MTWLTPPAIIRRCPGRRWRACPSPFWSSPSGASGMPLLAGIARGDRPPGGVADESPESGGRGVAAAPDRHLPDGPPPLAPLTAERWADPWPTERRSARPARARRRTSRCSGDTHTATEGAGGDEDTVVVRRGGIRPRSRRVLQPRTGDGAVGAPRHARIRRRHPLGGVVRGRLALERSRDLPVLVGVPLERARRPQAQSQMVRGGTGEVDRVRSRPGCGVPRRPGDRRGHPARAGRRRIRRPDPLCEDIRDRGRPADRADAGLRPPGGGPLGVRKRPPPPDRGLAADPDRSDRIRHGARPDTGPEPRGAAPGVRRLPRRLLRCAAAPGTHLLRGLDPGRAPSGHGLSTGRSAGPATGTPCRPTA